MRAIKGEGIVFFSLENDDQKNDEILNAHEWRETMLHDDNERTREFS